ncbi:MAG: hypothetical protein WCP36_03905 [Methanomicrobiales archaeon]
MKLPRGTFHSIKKGTLFRSLLDEMEKTRFTGYCTISWGIETCTLVLNSGIYILADYDKSEGEPAWQKMQRLLDTKVDAGLTSLNTVQLQLAREFNPHAALPSFVRKSPTRQVRTGIPNSTIRKEDIPVNAVPDTLVGHQKKQYQHQVSERGPAEKHSVETERTPGPIQVPEKPATENPEEECGTNIDRDLEALDNMDLDEMSKKIRESCKVTIENLNLDYLIDNRED